MNTKISTIVQVVEFHQIQASDSDEVDAFSQGVFYLIFNVFNVFNVLNVPTFTKQAQSYYLQFG